MSTILHDPKRRTVPRWRLWRDAVRLGDIDASHLVRVLQKPNPGDLIRSKFDWESHHSLPFAGDFIGKAYALGQGEMAKEAAEFVLSSKSPACKPVRDLAALILGASPDNVLSEPELRNNEDSHQTIHRLRRRLREFPRNALAYMDLAREYVGLGLPLAALKPVMIALSLAPNSRFILRSASRFFLHIKEPERAHYILRRAEVLKRDPWLVAAEISVASAAGRTSSLVKLGRQFVESKNFSAAHISELASALGTLEWEAGKIRLVKRHFRRALEQPTENAVAQVSFVFRQLGDGGIEPHVLDTPRSYEARSWAHTVDGHWTDSLNDAKLWLRDEPFANRPAVFGSWVALTVEDYATAERLARHGLMMDPCEFFLLNNLTVSLAYLGKIEDAVKEFAKIGHKDAEGPHKPTYLATKGLVRFRSGDVAEGRRLYRMSVVEANRNRDYRSAAWALLHFAREEFRYDPIMSEQLVKEAADAFPKLSKVEQTISRRLLELVKHS